MSHERANKHQQWRILVEEHAKSGLSQSEFCKQRKLILSRFVYYRGVANKAELKNTNITPSSFTPIQLRNPQQDKISGEIKLWLPNGFQLAFPSHLDPQQAKRWLEALLSC